MAARSGLPLLPPIWAPSDYGARFAYGHIVERGRHMIVSGGLGCTKVPLRLGVPPEIVRVDAGRLHLNQKRRRDFRPAPFAEPQPHVSEAMPLREATADCTASRPGAAPAPPPRCPA